MREKAHRDTGVPPVRTAQQLQMNLETAKLSFREAEKVSGIPSASPASPIRTGWKPVSQKAFSCNFAERGVFDGEQG